MAPSLVMEPAAAPPPPPARDAGRVLRRSVDDRVIGGVGAGLARYFGIDAAIVRILFVVLAVFGGSGLLAYIIAWIAIPEEKPGDAVGPASTSANAQGSVIIGALLVAAGVFLLLDQLVPGFRQILGPLLLIAVGLAILFGLRR
jgi:phage shock protein C